MLLDQDTQIIKETEGYISTINEELLFKFGWEHWGNPKQLKGCIYYRHPDHPNIMVWLDLSGVYHLNWMEVYMDLGVRIDTMFQLNEYLKEYKDVY